MTEVGAALTAAKPPLGTKDGAMEEREREKRESGCVSDVSVSVCLQYGKKESEMRDYNIEKGFQKVKDL